METQIVEKLDFETFKPKLGLWADKFKPFIESKEMWDIYQKLKKDSMTERIVPDSKNTFRAFSTSSPHNIKVVFYLMDPYPRLYKGTKIPQATGIPMDCSNSPDGKLQPSLEIFYNAMDKELDTEVVRSPNLEYLHEQGILLLNSDLTCKLNKTESHERLWEPFQKYLLEDILGSHTQIIYVLCGEASKRMERFISPFCNILFREHPAAAHRTHRDWESNDIFLTINKLLKNNNNDEVFWDYREWQKYSDPPF